ncbi:carbohydrate ABC transporter permease [Lactococcus carnosus]|uniref:Carbohydrate ABC transporter permease n=1 Tax=Pseudolactococcus carnosus TaxID=2749961 RepID=A0ABT0AT64_9LACT|nr:carbohydrate ABC transporter permease [Lactococcus carnosus]SCA92480.1 putative maltose and multiple sugars ABC transporter (permease)(Putative multiple sugar ABC transporter, membrane-spanning permease protein MsmG) [Lactococcus piscium]MCJ1969841.1 carbohydrate ABC transporter permease [Lactococcus carnosus]MCJ1974138.1 carbohydrate ABC transporter permease [Lactococcus carnosus]MCJ1975934.1 carbohydrate ABC transporter permease [Lactococcus carnosus]MCJ1980153.1 carbohydrate ABC transpor
MNHSVETAGQKLGKVVMFLILLVMGLVTIFPIAFMFMNSFKSQAEIVDSPLALPKEITFKYISNAMTQINLVPSFILTVIITVLAVTFIVLLSSSAAWMMVRVKSKLAMIILLVFTASMLIPFQAVMYPLISMFESVGLKNVPGLIIMYGGFGLAMSTFLYHGFMKSVPVSLEEAAIIDGANVFQVYFKIVMPLVRPTTVTVIILNAMWVWNDYLLPFLVLGDSENKTLTLALYYAKMKDGPYSVPWDLMFPAVLITVIPVIILFIFLQKQIIKGMADGAVK